MSVTVTSFYRYTTIENPEQFRDDHKFLLEKLDIRGTILVGTEGIKGTLSGSEKAIAAYETLLVHDNKFKDTIFTRFIAKEHPIKETEVQLHTEIENVELHV